MLIALPAIIVMSIIKLVTAETPNIDNTRTMYCVADNEYSKGEYEVKVKKPCTRGSMKVQHEMPSLAERKSK